VLLEDVSTADGAVSLAERILERMREPFEVKGYLVAATASIGISVNLSYEDEAEDLLRDADVTMYRSKEKGKNHHEVFDANMKGHFVERLALETDLRRAIEQDEFVLHYQPMVSLEERVIVGMEALLRWEHPRRGLVSPAGFVRVAEETELITPIGRWVLREACRQAK
jgi:predicted signal transduction protein with EAL and GGDEF domain